MLSERRVAAAPAESGSKLTTLFSEKRESNLACHSVRLVPQDATALVTPD